MPDNAIRLCGSPALEHKLVRASTRGYCALCRITTGSKSSTTWACSACERRVHVQCFKKFHEPDITKNALRPFYMSEDDPNRSIVHLEYEQKKRQKRKSIIEYRKVRKTPEKYYSRAMDELVQQIKHKKSSKRCMIFLYHFLFIHN